MNCYVINLASRPERLAHARETFGKAGIVFERFDAIDQERALEHPLRKKLPPLRSGRSWQPFELGCLASHFELWKRIAEGHDEFAAIFEDDVLVSEQLVPILEGDFPADADLVKLETVLQVVYLGRKRIPMRSGAASFGRLRSIHEGTGAYIVGRRAARELAEAAPMFDEPIDHALFSPKLARSRGLRVYQTVPAVVIQGILSPELRETPVMKSDRAANPAPALSIAGKAQQLLSRIGGRILNHARGIRTIVPFIGAS